MRTHDSRRQAHLLLLLLLSLATGLGAPAAVARPSLRGLVQRLLHRKAAPQPAAERKVVYFTGTFDPVHAGHLAVARAAARKVGAQRVVLVPNPPTGNKHPQPLADRIAMLKLATNGDPRLQVASPALVRRYHREGHSGLNRALRQSYGDSALYRVWGSDSFNRALRAGYVAQDTAAGRLPVVVARRGYALPRELAPSVQVVPDDATGEALSSTSIRAQLARGQQPRGLTPQVLHYIHDHGLYGAQPRPQAANAPH